MSLRTLGRVARARVRVWKPRLEAVTSAGEITPGGVIGFPF